MKRKEAEKLAIELGRFNFERGDDGFGGENVPHESAVKLLMGYVFAPPNCPACEKQTTSQYACTNNSCTQSNSDREVPAQPPCSECATLRKELEHELLERTTQRNLAREARENWKVRAEAAEAQLSTLRDALEKSESDLTEAKKDAQDWKREFEMYRDAWIRELGGWLFPKHHLIDALVSTTRARCVNPILGNCSSPHRLGKPTEDRKALQQIPHPQGSDCKEWAALAPTPEITPIKKDGEGT